MDIFDALEAAAAMPVTTYYTYCLPPVDFWRGSVPLPDLTDDQQLKEWEAGTDDGLNASNFEWDCDMRRTYYNEWTARDILKVHYMASALDAAARAHRVADTEWRSTEGVRVGAVPFCNKLPDLSFWVARKLDNNGTVIVVSEVPLFLDPSGWANPMIRLEVFGPRR